MTAQHHCTSRCALVRAPNEETKWWPPALGDASRLDLHVSYGQTGKCFHFLFLKAPQVSSLGGRGRAGEFVACFLLLLSAVGTYNQASRHKVSESEMLSLQCPIGAATALLSKAFVAIDLFFISQTCSCRQQNFKWQCHGILAGHRQPTAPSMQFHKAVPGCIWLLLPWWMVFRRTDLTAAESLGHLLGVTPVGGCQQSSSFPGSQGDKDSDEGGAWSLGLSALSAGLSFPGPAQRAGSLPFCSPNRRRGCWRGKPACTTKLLDA